MAGFREFYVLILLQSVGQIPQSHLWGPARHLQKADTDGQEFTAENQWKPFIRSFIVYTKVHSHFRGALLQEPIMFSAQVVQRNRDFNLQPLKTVLHYCVKLNPQQSSQNDCCVEITQRETNLLHRSLTCRPRSCFRSPAAGSMCPWGWTVCGVPASNQVNRSTRWRRQTLPASFPTLWGTWTPLILLKKTTLRLIYKYIPVLLHGLQHDSYCSGEDRRAIHTGNGQGMT